MQKQKDDKTLKPNVIKKKIRPWKEGHFEDVTCTTHVKQAVSEKVRKMISIGENHSR